MVNDEARMFSKARQVLLGCPTKHKSAGIVFKIYLTPQISILIKEIFFLKK
jgi:hypothetical protein